MAGSFEKQPSPQTAKQSQKQKPAPNTSLVDLIIADYLTQLFAIELLSYWAIDHTDEYNYIMCPLYRPFLHLFITEYTH